MSLILPPIGASSNGLPITTPAKILGSEGGLNSDSWGRPKAVIDKTIVHGVFTHGIDSVTWKETVNDIELSTFLNCTTIDGMLSVKAGTNLNDETVFDTFRHPRYQPNRGHLYASSLLMPNPTALGIRDAGYFTAESGYFFRLKSDGRLYACRQTLYSGIEENLIINTPPEYDPSKGNIYDIQMQWRGVGNVYFYIGDATTGKSKLVYVMNYLNQETALSIWNPANPIAFRAINLGDNVEINCGCVDISTEGGTDNALLYDSIDVDNLEGQVSITGFNAPVLAMRRTLLINGRHNTIDVQAFNISAYANAKCLLRVWVTRDFTAITPNDQTWISKGNGIEYITYDVPDVVTPMSFDTTKATNTFSMRVPIDGNAVSSALFENRSTIYQTAGDMFVFTIHRETGSQAIVGANYEFGIEK